MQGIAVLSSLAFLAAWREKKKLFMKLSKSGDA